MKILKKIFGCEDYELSMFLVRIGVALVFINHGWLKLQNIDGTVAFFGSLGLAAFFAYLILIAELAGGILMLLGFFTRPLGWIFVGIMFFAIILVKAGKGFTGYEFELLILLASLAITLHKPSKYSLQKIFSK